MAFDGMQKKILAGHGLGPGARKGGGNWIAGARARMEKKGTVGAFGKATVKKIAAGKAAGGLQEKRAVFAQNVKKIAARRRL